jgi:hypothetical protein
MSSTQFTKADWRPGKRRRTVPRVRDYPGQKVAPAAFLAAGRFVGLHTPTAKRCSRIAVSTGKPCRHVAMKGTTLCLQHGGGGMAKRIRPYVSTLPALKARIREALEKAEKAQEQAVTVR